MIEPDDEPPPFDDGYRDQVETMPPAVQAALGLLDSAIGAAFPPETEAQCQIAYRAAFNVLTRYFQKHDF